MKELSIFVQVSAQGDNLFRTTAAQNILPAVKPSAKSRKEASYVSCQNSACKLNQFF
jgi:hypothetical protein